MTFYQSEITRIKDICYSNDRQIQTVIGIRKFIDQYFHEEIDLNQLSDIGFTSKYHLLRLFKKFYGQTPGQYLTDTRIEKSKIYLKQGMSVTETCFSVGFESPSSFSALFKKRNGQSPTNFQKEQFSISRLDIDS